MLGRIMRRFYFLFLLMFLTACAGTQKDAPVTLTAKSFQDLPGWQGEQFDGIALAFGNSCQRIMRSPAERSFGSLAQAGTYADWQNVCRDFLAMVEPDRETLRAFFETRFVPYQVGHGHDKNGLFTGYYEASLNGSRARTERYRYPLHARPGDLVMVDLGEFRDELKGQRIAGRVQSGRLKPYEERAEIVQGQWPHNDKVLVWVDDPVDAFFVQIQGSGVISMESGEAIRINYDGQNGHPYYAIGRELVKRKHLSKKDVSMQAIRDWLEANPQEAAQLMNTNKSYVFFKESAVEGAVGGEGVVLTPGRSLAVDHSRLSYGLPMWVDIAPPLDDGRPIRQMMIAQDTGGAIRGSVRGDVYWGYGPQAEHLAGHMKSKGRYWALLPKTQPPEMTAAF